jgi:hypothetical protein
MVTSLTATTCDTYWPTINENAGDTITANPMNAYDRDLSTYATVTANGGNGGDPQSGIVFYKGFTKVIGTPSTVTLSVTASTSGSSSCSDTIQYSLDNGSHFSLVPSLSGIYTKTTSTVSLPATQDITQVILWAEADCPSGMLGVNIRVYEISIQAV